MDIGLNGKDRSCIVMEKGRFYGMGYLPSEIQEPSLDEIKKHVTAYTENDYIRGLIYQHATRHPEKKIELQTI